MRVLILCTGNSCRSQMAHGWLQSFDSKLEVFSAGTRPEKEVNKYAVMVMKEAGIDISHHTPMNVNEYINQDFDFVITVCDNAREICPVFTGITKHKMHIGFDDPANATGTEDEKLIVYRDSRDLIKKSFQEFYKNFIIKN